MRILASLLLAIALGPASAAIVTFDSYAPRYDFSGSIETDGLRFTAPCPNCVGIEDRQPTDLGGLPLPGAFNGTPTLLYGTDPLSIAAADGSAFFLDRLDLGLSWYVPDIDVGSTITVTYQLTGGGTGSVSAVLDRSYSTLLIGQAVLGASISGGRGFGYISLDNVVFNTVPEPESTGLAVVALAGAAFAWWRRRAPSRGSRP